MEDHGIIFTWLDSLILSRRSALEELLTNKSDLRDDQDAKAKLSAMLDHKRAIKLLKRTRRMIVAFGGVNGPKGSLFG